MHEDDVRRYSIQAVWWVLMAYHVTLIHIHAFGELSHELLATIAVMSSFPMTTAIYKMTGMLSTTFFLKDRGLIQENYFADIVVFDLKN